MTPFEFVFALFVLLLGLSIAEMLGGLARSIKLHDKVRIGWLTPLLAVEILVNLTTFWFESWRLRDQGAPTLGSMLITLALSGAYYLAASLVFPDPGKEPGDLDEHFMVNKRAALGVILGCNLAALTIVTLHAGTIPGGRFWLTNALFLGLLAATAFTTSRRWSLAGLVTLLCIHAFAVVVTM
ncbi:hypothetical protein [Sphingomonas sp. LaA6.9]|uniref:hypothetical protein n=1 Tax=Sphingomonas sp. LaA6.9 TaxID=2919914 RepID=UPI001F4FABF7|nr:hypothetical protein [Sphingomonas sp. LaA6.9]MCJ8156683.1 hypothetical protein [Sphingomonas sp. LaA6.9]